MQHSLSRTIANIANLTIATILPSRCPSCGDIVRNDQTDTIMKQSGFCISCWSELKFITPPWCISCARPFEFIEEGVGAEHLQCGVCIDTPPNHDGIRAALIYDDINSKVLLKLKYSGRIAIAKLIADHLQRFFHADLQNNLNESGNDMWIAPVPLHWTRLWKRTYNQSALIADAMIKIYSDSGGSEPTSHIVDLLKRVKRTPPLRGNSGKDRKKLLKDAFSLNPKYRQQITGRTIILVDDVYTSGATTDACVKTLKAAGAEKVIIYCWTRVIK